MPAPTISTMPRHQKEVAPVDFLLRSPLNDLWLPLGTSCVAGLKLLLSEIIRR